MAENIPVSMDLNDGNKSVEAESSDVKTNVVPSIPSDNKSSDMTLRGNWSKFRDRLQRRKRPRRKSKKGKFPYNKSTWQQRRQENRSERALRVREEMFAHGQPVAPYNTTQFLIEDHGDVQCIDAQLQEVKGKIPSSSLAGNKTSRARDSSFSIDSDDDYFYCSPEDEEEFLTKEFSNAYEDLHVERLSSMSKSEIIYDFLQLESKYEKCLAEVRRLKRTGGDQAGDPPGDPARYEIDVDTDTSSKSENELAEKLRIAQLENKTMLMEVEDLRKENKKLHSLLESKHSSSSSSSSVDSDSDSSSTSSMSDSSSLNDTKNSDSEIISTTSPLQENKKDYSEEISTTSPMQDTKTSDSEVVSSTSPQQTEKYEAELITSTMSQ